MGTVIQEHAKTVKEIMQPHINELIKIQKQLERVELNYLRSVPYNYIDVLVCYILEIIHTIEEDLDIV